MYSVDSHYFDLNIYNFCPGNTDGTCFVLLATIASNSRCNSLLPFANASIGTRLSLNTCEPRIFSNSNQNLYKKQSLIIRRISLACITQTCRSWLWRPPTSYTLNYTPPRKTTSNGWLVACHRHYKFAQDFPLEYLEF